MTITKDHEEVAPYVDAINSFYGRGDIPIGIVSGSVTPRKSRFTGVTREKVDGSFVYPHDLRLGDPVPDATHVLREVLAAQPDRSVVIVQVGFSTNLARLLASEGDLHSDLAGSDLVAQKVKMLSMMAGSFAPIDGRTHLEYNVVEDVPAARVIAGSWPTPIVWSGYEIGLAIRYPAASIEADFRYRERHPIPESYQAYLPTPHERPTWDLTSVLHVVRPERGYFDLSDSGTVTVDEAGKTTFTASPDGRHAHLKLDSMNLRRIRELMAALVSEPPQNP